MIKYKYDFHHNLDKELDTISHIVVSINMNTFQVDHIIAYIFSMCHQRNILKDNCLHNSNFNPAWKVHAYQDNPKHIFLLLDLHTCLDHNFYCIELFNFEQSIHLDMFQYIILLFNQQNLATNVMQHNEDFMNYRKYQEDIGSYKYVMSFKQKYHSEL